MRVSRKPSSRQRVNAARASAGPGRDQRILQFVIARRVAAVIGDPRLDAHHAVHGDAGLAFQVGGGDDRQREALVDDQPLDPGITPELLQVAGRIGAQSLQAGSAHGLVGRLAPELRGETLEQRQRERRARRRLTQHLGVRGRIASGGQHAHAEHGHPLGEAVGRGGQQLRRAPAVQMRVDHGRVAEVDHGSSR
jgi:hypothetical protein